MRDVHPEEWTNQELVEVLNEILQVIHTSEHPPEYSLALRESIFRLRELGQPCIIA